MVDQVREGLQRVLPGQGGFIVVHRKEATDA